MAAVLWGLWGQVWPNIVADVVMVGAGFVWHHRRVRALLAAHHTHIVEELHVHRAALGTQEKGTADGHPAAGH